MVFASKTPSSTINAGSRKKLKLNDFNQIKNYEWDRVLNSNLG